MADGLYPDSSTTVVVWRKQGTFGKIFVFFLVLVYNLAYLSLFSLLLFRKYGFVTITRPLRPFLRGFIVDGSAT